jgi:hypothetical protein
MEQSISEKLTATQLFEKFSAFHETQNFIIVPQETITTAHPEQINPIQRAVTCTSNS